MKNGSAQARRLSAVAAALLLNTTLPGTAAVAEEALVQCGGVTGCHGSSDCKTVAHACKGHNTCMGQGFKNLTRAECERRGGIVSTEKESVGKGASEKQSIPKKGAS
jgi:hypothetical protein